MENIKSYWNQLSEIAEDTGWQLKDACIDSGVSDSTYYRWKTGKFMPSQGSAERIAGYMQQYRR